MKLRTRTNDRFVFAADITKEKTGAAEEEDTNRLAEGPQENY